jgi:hypothetical protein
VKTERKRIDLGGVTRSASGFLCAVLLFGTALATAQEPETATAGLTREEKEQFLLHAEILEIQTLSIGVTGSQRAILSDGTLTHDAHIQTVDIFMKKFAAGAKTEFNFRDYHGFNVAAYRLSELLGLNMVPVSVARTIQREKASVSWWVDAVMMSGEDFRESGGRAPISAAVGDQRDQGQVFQQLICNKDPNLGNFVIDESWKVWMLDFSRAFRTQKKLDDPERLGRIGRGLYTRLRELDPAEVERELGPHLSKGELKGLLARRDRLVRHFEKEIAERGEAAVLIDRPGF